MSDPPFAGCWLARNTCLPTQNFFWDWQQLPTRILDFQHHVPFVPIASRWPRASKAWTPGYHRQDSPACSRVSQKCGANGISEAFLAVILDWPRHSPTLVQLVGAVSLLLLERLAPAQRRPLSAPHPEASLLQEVSIGSAKQQQGTESPASEAVQALSRHAQQRSCSTFNILHFASTPSRH